MDQRDDEKQPPHPLSLYAQLQAPRSMLPLAVPLPSRPAPHRLITPPSRISTEDESQSRVNPNNLPLSAPYDPFSSRGFHSLAWDDICDPLSPTTLDSILPHLRNLSASEPSKATYSAALSSVSVSPSKEEASLSADPREHLVISTRNWFVLKMRNISWDLSMQDIRAYFSPLKLHLGHTGPRFTHAVHIPINRTTGKTHTCCFVEFATFEEAENALKHFSRGVVKGRIVALERSSQRELLMALFPSRFTSQDDEILSAPLSPGVYLGRQEISSVLLICKNYKIISILCKVPWVGEDSVTTMQRDHLFELLKLTIEALVHHLTKDVAGNIDGTLLPRLVRAGLVVPKFTEKQKNILLTTSGLACPEDLKEFMTVSELFKPPQITPPKEEEKLEIKLSEFPTLVATPIKTWASAVIQKASLPSPPETNSE